MAYDSVRGRTVLFGGFNDSNTWEWDGAAWRLVATTGPDYRWGAAMAFDQARGKIVLFGGFRNRYPELAYFDDTWEWDGAKWTQIQSTGPSPRRDVAMAYDSTRERVVLFGGKASGQPYDLGDTWEWDGKTWTQLPATGLSPRSGAAMAYDSVRGKMVLFGGFHYSELQVFHGDTWELDGTTWIQVANTGPEPRTNAAIVFDNTRGKIVLFGGASTSEPYVFADTWLWDGTEWTPVATPGPVARSDAAMAFDNGRGKAVLFGGSSRVSDKDGYLFGDTWEWDGAGWEESESTRPGPREGAAMVYDSGRKELVLFGGHGHRQTTSNTETWIWNGNRWRLAATTGPPTSPHPDWMAYDSVRGRTVLLRDGDTWEWDGGSWQQVAGVGPVPQAPSAMAYDSARGRTVVFTGSGATWEYDGKAWQQVAANGPAPRQAAAMAYDSARGKCVLFGGYSGSGYSMKMHGDTWEWDGSAWSQMNGTGPSPRAYASMAYDSIRNQIVLFGGAHFEPGGAFGYYTVFGDTWVWDGPSWTQVPGSGPGNRYLAAMAFDTTNEKTILFGGKEQTYQAGGNLLTFTYGDMWAFSTIPETFTLSDAVNALRRAGGLDTGLATDLARLDIAPSTAPDGRVDIEDACCIARIVAGLEVKP